MWIPKTVTHNAMAFRMQAGDKGVVVGKSNAREAWEHILWGDAFGDEGV